MIQRTLALAVGTSLLAACAVEEDRTSRKSPEYADSTRIKNQVLEIVCDHEGRDVQRELVPVVNYARERDGRSDRVWEVADKADCDNLPVGDPA